ncbi:hypothetical protein [Lactiplantibacillus xiangfangensis]|uniref:DUF1659 domain-containing protein n=1 Tax=Lactiplantibacillus xiangfangensis TaxID=942150 RepID=A0A0R2MQW0_9LACO|nr:hypothetical protein [Lactiplantibacillus xiangfangensis]KRO14608.1 hypothetical protein IV64_GL001008 [Lactiplantibacillus xiangfangensis]
MKKTWLKATLAVLMTTDTDVKRKQSFNAITQDATDEQLAAFGKVLEALTGNDFVSANITNAYQYTSTPAA